MIAIWVLTFILQAFDFAPAVELWQWFGEHVIITILLLIFLA